LIKVEFLRYQTAFSDFQELSTFLINLFFSGKIFELLKNYLVINKEMFMNNLFPWYWGVFGWLEVTMPLTIYRILKLICLISLVGLVAWFFKVKRKSTEKKNVQKVLFLIFSLLVYTLALIFTDMKIFYNGGVAFGLQGRYFLPLISAQMILFFLGLKTLIPRKHQDFLFISLCFGSLILNIVGYWTMYHYFYG
jgi:hypothetical protein